MKKSYNLTNQKQQLTLAIALQFLYFILKVHFLNS